MNFDTGVADTDFVESDCEFPDVAGWTDIDIFCCHCSFRGMGSFPEYCPQSSVVDSVPSFAFRCFDHLPLPPP